MNNWSQMNLLKTAYIYIPLNLLKQHTRTIYSLACEVILFLYRYIDPIRLFINQPYTDFFLTQEITQFERIGSNIFICFLFYAYFQLSRNIHDVIFYIIRVIWKLRITLRSHLLELWNIGSTDSKKGRNETIKDHLKLYDQ